MVAWELIGEAVKSDGMKITAGETLRLEEDPSISVVVAVGAGSALLPGAAAALVFEVVDVGVEREEQAHEPGRREVQRRGGGLV